MHFHRIYYFSLRSRPFTAIKNRTKKVEGRTPKDVQDKRYEQIEKGDGIIFENEETHELLKVKVLFVHHYTHVRSMLEQEGVRNVLSSGGDIEEGIQSYHALGDYEERIKKFGIYAIGIEPIEE